MLIYPDSWLRLPNGRMMITGNKSCHLSIPGNYGVSASVYPELVRYIFQIRGEKCMNDMGPAENRKSPWVHQSELSAHYLGFIMQ